MIKTVFKQAFAAGLLLAVITGCSVVEEKRQAYRQAESVPPLELPQYLDATSSDSALMVPEVKSTEAPNPAPPPYNPK